MGDPRRRRHRPARRQRRLHRPDVGAPRRPRPARDARRRASPRRASSRRCSGTYLALDPARADGPQPVARRGVRHGPPRVGAPLARVRDRLADRRPRRPDDDRATRRATAPASIAEAVDAPDDLPVRPVGDRRVRPVRDGRRELDPRGPAPAVVRDLVRPPPRTPTSRSPSRSCTSCSSARTSCTTSSPAIYWIALYVLTAALVLTFRVGQPRRDLAAPPAPRRRRSSTRRRASSPSTSRAATSTGSPCAPASTSCSAS